MMMIRFHCLAFACLSISVLLTGLALGDTTVRLADDPALSPDGRRLAFAYGGDIWTVATRGGIARRVTTHPAADSQPRFSPDGRRLAYISRRSGSDQIWVQDVNRRGVVTGVPRQVTHHTAGYSLLDWYPDGEHLLASGSRDDYWYRRENVRFYRVDVAQRRAQQMLFDAYGTEASLSPDGQSLLFQREGVEWWRKGYHGSRAAQIWRYDTASEQYTEMVRSDSGERWPLWRPDDSGFYFVSQRSGSFNLWQQDFGAEAPTQLTNYQDDSVVLPTLSADGSTLVYRHRFDLYRLDLEQRRAEPQRINIRIAGQDVAEELLRRTVSSVDDATFTPDGLELAVAAGGDIWVMDTELREPINVTDSAVEESQPRFIDDGAALLLLREHQGTVNLWKAQRSAPDEYWWRQDEFLLTQLTDFSGTVTALQVSPSGCRIAYVRQPGRLFVADLDGGNSRLVASGFDVPNYDFSPDGRWLAYAQKDNDFNSDIWIVPTDGSRLPVNISRHPKNDYAPRWSPDGRILAFTGVREISEVDLHYVYLKRDDADATSRDRRLESALKKLADARKKKSQTSSSKSTETSKAAGKEDQQKVDVDDASKTGDKDPEDDVSSDDCPPAAVEIDFDDIHQRVQRIRIPDASVSSLFWFGDGQKLAFAATIDGRSGTYLVEFPDELSPQLLTSDRGRFIQRLQDPKRVGWISSSTPATLGVDGKLSKYGFSARQQIDRAERFEAGFDVAWRLMRDHWYDDRFNNRNWDAIRRKYREVAAAAPDASTFATVVRLMLGELNGSHLGFSPRGVASAEPDGWVPQTAHLGVRFDLAHRGPGLKIRDVLPGGPADRQASRLRVGETILSVDSVPVDPDFDLTLLLNGPLDRDITLRVRAAEADNQAEEDDAAADDSDDSADDAADGEPDGEPDGETGAVDRGDREEPQAEPAERQVVIRPISYSQARSLLYPMWEQANRQRVEQLSDGRLGYLHIQGMNMSSLHEFERQLFNVGLNKQGMLIDVRGNGGGSTADRLLTALTQPRHAITVPRGGGPGYPQDRSVYATWHKPIVVLCNQGSFSNAEIFSHAIRTLGRGRLVGVRTAGGVISTGWAAVLDLGRLRQPYRGWFVADTGQDMELAGARPHVEIWPLPGEMPRGDDRVLRRAVRMLSRDVERDAKQPPPELTRASERDD